jgi:hypothetical protein
MIYLQRNEEKLANEFASVLKSSERIRQGKRDFQIYQTENTLFPKGLFGSE